MKTKNFKPVTIIMLFLAFSAFVSCESDEDGNVTDPETGEEVKLIDAIWNFFSLSSNRSEDITGSAIFRSDNSYTYDLY